MENCKLQLSGRSCCRSGIDITLCNIYRVVDPVIGITDILVCRWPIGNDYYYLDQYYQTTEKVNLDEFK